MNGWKRPKVNYENDDRFCVECGRIIYGQARYKLERCPYGSCKKPIFLRSPEWVNGWSKCVTCDSNINEAMLFCEPCSRPNPKGFERRQRLEQANILAWEAKLNAHVKELQDKLKSNEAQLDETVKKNEELQLIVNSQEREWEFAKLKGLDLEKVV